MPRLARLATGACEVYLRRFTFTFFLYSAMSLRVVRFYLLAAAFLAAFNGLAQTSRAQARPVAAAAGYQYLQMTTIESVVPGGFGRSRVLFTPEWKGTKETNMENLFSLTGINLGNVRSNEEAILRFMGEITSDGWELVQAVPLTQVLNGTGGQSSQGIFMTRYLFRKAK